MAGPLVTPTRRPLWNAALWYIAGVVLAGRLSPGWSWALACAWVGVLVYGRWAGVRRWWLGPVLLATGLCNHALSTAPVSPHDLRRLVGEEPVLGSIRGQLLETPRHRWPTQQKLGPGRTLVMVTVSEIRLGEGSWGPAVGRVMTSTPGPWPGRHGRGEWVEVSGVLKLPPGPAARGLFDYRAHLAAQRVYRLLEADSTGDWTWGWGTNRFEPGWAERVAAWAEEQLLRGLPERDLAAELMLAMTLGYRTALTGEVTEPFMQSGTMHIFAISGMHVALIAAALVSLLRVFRVSRMACGWVALPLLWGYAAVTGWPASAVRAVIMTSVLTLGWALCRPHDLLNSLAGAALIILVWDPGQLFQLGFQLSFLVVLSLVLLGPMAEAWRRRWLEPDPALPEALRSRWWRWRRRGVDYVTLHGAASVVAWLGSLPLVAGYFHYLNPVSVVANVVIVPVSGMALVCNMGSLMVGGVWPWLGELFNHSGWFWMTLMMRLSAWAAALPGGWWHVASPPAVWVTAYYGVLACVLGQVWQRPVPRVAALLILIGLFGAGIVQVRADRSVTRLHVLPNDGGQTGFLIPPRARDRVLIDAGSAAAATRVTIPFLKAQGVNALPTILLTHGDIRHVGGVGEVMRVFGVDAVGASRLSFRSKPYRDLTGALAKAGRLRSVEPGTVVGPWRVWYPSREDQFAQADDKAMVLGAQFHGTEVLWLSDLGAAGQNALLNRHPELRAEIVITGLPSKSEPVTDGFLEMVRPKVVVVCDAQHPANERASRVLQERLQRHSIAVHYTRLEGALTLEFREDGYRVVRH